MYDVAIIGTGAAGISAALTLQSRGKSILLLGKRELSAKMTLAEEIRNYPGLGFVSGKQMQEGFINHLAQMNIGIVQKHVTEIAKTGDSFKILCGQETFDACSVILATGVSSLKTYEGEERLLGKGVSYCATCDGFLYKDQPIAVVCTSKDFEGEIEYLEQTCSKIYLVANYKNPKQFSDKVSMISGKNIRISGNEYVEMIQNDTNEYDVKAVFILRDNIAPSSMIKNLQTENGHIAINRMCETNITGCYAAGDCTGRPYQYVKAAGEGNVAAHSVLEYLSETGYKGNAKTRPYKKYPLSFDDAIDVTDLSNMPTDQTIDDLVRFRLTNGEVEFVEKDVCEKGDIVTITVKGGVGRYNRENIRVTIGQNLYDYEAENKLVGKRTGETISVLKDSEITITIHGIQTPVSKELTDEMVRALNNPAVTTLNQYYQMVKQEAQQAELDLITYHVLSEIHEQTPTTETPEEVIVRLGELEKEFFDKLFAQQMGKGILSMNEEELKKNLGVSTVDEFIASRRDWYQMKYNQLLGLSKAMNIELTDEFDYMNKYEVLMNLQTMAAEKIKNRVLGGMSHG
ncbi:MAG: FAD-dependent oxidoreductase [Erysipelotrichaceae bacterium]|nr:FAD-dependent oxidoreductase [Erysipelotrichaceae bacterium]